MKCIWLVVLLPVAAFSQQNSWVKKKSFDIELERSVGFSINGYGYAGTGQDSANLMRNDLWKYDPVLDIWTQVASMPAVGRRNAIAFVVNDKAYVGTGIDNADSFLGNTLNDFWEYDPVTNGWTAKAPFPGAFNQGIYFATAFAADSKGYVCCGKISPSNYSNELWEYKPLNNQWTQRASFPGGTRYQLSSLVIEDKAYVGLGTDENAYANDWWMYNPGNNTWTAKTDMPGPDRASASTFVLGPRGFVMFGSDGGFLDDLWEYNPWNDSWSIRASFPGGDRRNAFSFSIGNKGYAGTGKGSAGVRRNFYEYTPLTPTQIDEEGAVAVCIYPNPVSDRLNIKTGRNHENVCCSLFDLSGRKILTVTAADENIRIPVADIPEATYVLKMQNDQGIVYYSQRIIIAHE